MLIDWTILPALPGMRPGATRKAIAATQLSAVRVVTRPDAQFDSSLHKHDNEQFLIMLSGEIHLQIDEEKMVAREGDLVFFPPGSYHGAIGVGSSGAEYYEIFAPARYDQLPGWIGPSVLEYK